MSLEDRCVFDTNTIVSSFLFAASTPNRAFRAVAPDCILLSSETFAELEEVLRRPKFDRYVDLSIREAFLELLAVQSRFVDLTEGIQACRDPRDDKFLELAVSGTATCIVTGDQDLLSLHPFRGIPILTPAQFLAAITPEST